MAEVDPNHADEVVPRASPIARAFYLTLGFISLGLGVVGALLPVLPTTPFVILAAACFARSSPRFYRWLLRTRWFGPLIRNYRRHGTVSVRAKATAIAMIVLSIGATIAFVVRPLPLRILLAAIGLAVIAYLLRLPAPGSVPRGDA